jgi:hypothetical protein
VVLVELEALERGSTSYQLVRKLALVFGVIVAAVSAVHLLGILLSVVC